MRADALGAMKAGQVGSLSEGPVLLLPVGSCEQHGPHLPLETDTYIAERFASAAAQRAALHRVIVLPALPYGISAEHSWCPGTLSLPVEAFIQVVRAVCMSAVASLRPRALVIVNGHGGNHGALESIVREIAEASGVLTCAVNPIALSSVPLASSLPDVHAAKAETSVMLHLAPSKVDQTPMARTDRDLGRQISAAVLDRGVVLPWTSNDERFATDGVIGDPTGASADLGAEIWLSALQGFEELLPRLIGPPEGAGWPAEPAGTSAATDIPTDVVEMFLRCPREGARLTRTADATLTCAACSSDYRIEEGVALLTLPDDEPLEGTP